MADSEASLIVKLRDMASSGLNGLQGALGKLKANFLAVSAAMAGTIAFITSAIKAHLEEEAAINKLNVALKNQGVFSQATSKDLQAYANQLQSVTTFGNETVLETMALLTTFGLAGDELKKVTKAALDLSVGLDMDLRTATMLLGKAAVGETGALARFGITIADGIPPAERLGAVMTKVNQIVGGSAEAALNTTAGRLQNFSERVGDLKQRIGGLLIPVLEFFVNKLSTIVGMFEQLSQSEAPLVRFVATATQLFLEMSRSIVDFILKPIEALKPLLEKLGVDISEPIAAINAFFDEQAAKLDNWALSHEMAAQRQVMAEQMKDQQLQAMGLTRQQFLDQQAAKEADREAKKNAKLQAERQKHDNLIRKLDEQIAKEKEAFFNSQIEWQQKMTKMEKDEQEKRKQNLHSTLNFISQLSTAKNKELALIGKGTAIGVATIDTWVAATKALASAPPPWNIALAAGVTAAGMANVARISGVQLAEGGVVLPRMGGTLATIGEAGRAEAVIPLDDPEAHERMGGLGGNTTVNITIQAGAFMGDPMQARQFAELIDEELFKLSRTGNSVNFGSRGGNL